MEEAGILCPDDDIDMYCLHVCFFHIIQQDLDSFRYGWNQHRIRTANNMTPTKLFIAGLHNLASYSKQTRKTYTELIQVMMFKLYPLKYNSDELESVGWNLETNWWGKCPSSSSTGQLEVPVTTWTRSLHQGRVQLTKDCEIKCPWSLYLLERTLEKVLRWQLSAFALFWWFIQWAPIKEGVVQFSVFDVGSATCFRNVSEDKSPPV